MLFGGIFNAHKERVRLQNIFLLHFSIHHREYFIFLKRGTVKKNWSQFEAQGSFRPSCMSDTAREKTTVATKKCMKNEAKIRSCVRVRVD